MRIHTGLTTTPHYRFYLPRLYETIAILFWTSAAGSHCNVSNKGFWTHSISWVMQYTLTRRIPSHPTLSAFQVSWYSHWTICSWVCESGGKNNACNASDKPPSSVHHLPAGSITQFTRVRVRELKNAHNSVTVQNRTHVYVNFFDHKDLGNHLLQLCPKVVKHPVCLY